jgi:hypothetical protein
MPIWLRGRPVLDERADEAAPAAAAGVRAPLRAAPRQLHGERREQVEGTRRVRRRLRRMIT